MTTATVECPLCDAFPYATQEELAAHLRVDHQIGERKYDLRFPVVQPTLHPHHGSQPTPAPAPVQNGRFETVPSINGGTTTRRIRTEQQAKPASDRQKEYVRTLIAERPADHATVVEVKATLNAARAAGPLTFTLVSAQIDRLLKVEKAPRPQVERPAADKPQVPAGYYALEGDDGLRFYRVEQGKGRWDGYTFLSVCAGPDEHPVRGAGATPILARIAADPEGASRLYGTEIGRCGRCGRRLTNDESRAFGIGPECREKGW